MKKNKIIGITFGSFDLCHYGHALMFEECKEYCDYLIVGVQSDPSIDRPEKNKPVQSHEERIGPSVQPASPFAVLFRLQVCVARTDPDARDAGRRRHVGD